MDASVALEIRSNLSMFRQMSIKRSFYNCFNSAFWTLVYFPSNCRYKIWMFSNHVIIQ
nr:unnamed protein product [Callosobruchus chinensis]